MQNIIKIKNITKDKTTQKPPPTIYLELVLLTKIKPPTIIPKHMIYVNKVIQTIQKTSNPEVGSHPGALPANSAL